MRAIALVVALPLALSAAAATNPLTLHYSATVPGGLAVAATCINWEDPGRGGPTGGVLDLVDCPAGASVQKALLYWSVLSSTSPVDTGAPTMDGQPLSVVGVGEVPTTPCYGDGHFTGIFRADVTGLVAGPGSHALAGFPGTGTSLGTITEGASLFVVYCAAGHVETDVVIFDGADVVDNRTRGPLVQRLSGFRAAGTAPVRGVIAAAAGNGQSRIGEEDPDPFELEGIDLDARDPAILSGALGLSTDILTGIYDRTLADVSGLIAPDATEATLVVRSVGDCYSIGAVALAVETIPGAAITEPSAMDLRPAAPPLLVSKAGVRTVIRWEDLGPSAMYDVYAGTVGNWYDHGAVGACALTSPTVTLDLPAGSQYLLACSVGCGGGESSLGRDSFGRARPSALAASGRGCP